MSSAFEPIVSETALSHREGVDLASTRWIVIDRRNQVLLIDGTFPVGGECPLPVGETHLLGVEDTAVGGPVPVRTAVLEEWVVAGEAGPAEDAIAVDLRRLFGMVPDADWALAGRAVQIVGWDRDHRFCGRCGEATAPQPTERARRCPACGLLAFPRISPAVIVLVERPGRNGPEVLLAWGRQFPARFFSALAGFVEPGESLEECVVREVREETGIEVGDVRYFGSQPWPFPHSLMVGFTASYVSGDLVIQEEEIVEAGWFGLEELPPVPRGGMSIAGWLIEAWLDRV